MKSTKTKFSLETLKNICEAKSRFVY